MAINLENPMPNHLSEAGSSYIQAEPPLKRKENRNQEENKTAQNLLIFVYQAKIADSFRNITVTWCKNLVNHYISFNVENPSDDQHLYTCKIDLQVSQFWNKKGLKNFEVDSKSVYVYWDFRQAKFSDSPAPSSDYYVAIVDEEEIVLLLGICSKMLTREPKGDQHFQGQPCYTRKRMLYKKENVFGKRLFCTRGILGEGKEEHDIVIENSLLSPGDPEMWISIDGITTIRILNLYWRFRGNEIISINNTSVQIFWDVHDWLFNESSSSYGLFIFNPNTNIEGYERNCRNGKVMACLIQAKDIAIFCMLGKLNKAMSNYQQAMKYFRE